MAKQLFEYKDYRSVLQELQANHGRGYFSVLATAMKSHRSVLPQVMSGKVELTLDQAADLCRFWQFSEDETEYFVDLVNLSRASSPKLKESISRRLKRAKEAAIDIAKGLPKNTGSISKDTESLYYSSTLYASLHILSSIPEFQSAERMADQLSVPAPAVVSGLTHLVSIGLIERNGKKWAATGKSLHLDKSSPLYKTNNVNWRLKAISAMEFNDATNINYTGVHSLSHECREEFRTQLLNLIKTFQKKIADSKEETAVCVNIDLFGF